MDRNIEDGNNSFSINLNPITIFYSWDISYRAFLSTINIGLSISN